MAEFIKSPNKNKNIYYYARITSVKWPKPRNIPLGQDIDDAYDNFEEVKANEHLIKRGKTIQWSWDPGNYSGRAKLLKKNIPCLIKEWNESTKIKLRPSALQRYNVSLKHFMKYIGKSRPIKSIDTKLIGDYVKCCVAKKQSKNGIDLNLRSIKVFLKWAYQEGYIKKIPKFTFFNLPAEIKYINDQDWKKLMEMDIDTYWKDVWIVYRDLGLRLQEMIMGEVEQKILITSIEYSKSKKRLVTPINSSQKKIILQIHKKRDEFLSKGYNYINFKNRYSKVFSKACKQLNINATFHSLRHTFAVRLYIQTDNIFEVCKRLNHSDINTTIDNYGQFRLEELELDFKDLFKQIKNSPFTTPFSTTPSSLLASSRLKAEGLARNF